MTRGAGATTRTGAHVSLHHYMCNYSAYWCVCAAVSCSCMGECFRCNRVAALKVGKPLVPSVFQLSRNLHGKRVNLCLSVCRVRVRGAAVGVFRCTSFVFTRLNWAFLSW